MPQEKVPVAARISRDLYTKCLQDYDTISAAIIAGLELLYDNECKQNVNNEYTTVNNDSGMRTRIEEKDARIKELQDQLKVKDDQIKVNDEHQNNRIEDLKNHIYLLDNQLRTKDDQIEKLNENMHKQAVHIQSLIQENSRMNAKLLPENIEKKKPFWKFW